MTDVEIDTNVKDFTNRINFGIIVCTSGTRPNAVDGKTIYETDTDKLLIYNGATWAEITGGGVTDHGALTGLTDDDHTQYLLIDGTREMTGNLDMGANNVYLDSGVLRMSDGTGLSGSIGFTTGVQNYIQRQLVSGSDYTLLSDQDYMHTWAILGTEKMHLSTADGLKMYTKINMNGMDINLLPAGTTNGDALRYEQIADASFINLLKNGDFESWSAGTTSAPDGWTLHGTGITITRSATKKIGEYSVEITYGSVTSYIRHSIPDYERYRSKIITLAVWVKTSTASQVKIQLADNVGNNASDYHSGGGDWELLTVSRTVDTSATTLVCNLILYDTGVAYFDGAILVEGSICPEFSPKPLVDDGKSIQIDSTTNSVTIGGDLDLDENEIKNAVIHKVADATTRNALTPSEGQIVYQQDNDTVYIYDGAAWDIIGGTADHSTLSNLTWSTAGHTINANIDMNDNNITEANEIQATASQNLTLKVSTGSSIVFQAV